MRYHENVQEQKPGSRAEGQVSLLKRDKPFLLASVGYPPVQGAVGTIMKQLLDRFERGSAVVGTCRWLRSSAKTADQEATHPRHEVSLRFGNRLDRLAFSFEWRVAALGLRRLVYKYDCRAVLAVFPDLPMVRAAIAVAEACRIPFLVHLHDTVEESLSGTPYERMAREVESAIFRRPWQALPLTGGLKEHYGRKYGTDFIELPHPYSEDLPVSFDPTPFAATACWSGNVYAINDRSFVRLFDACRMAGARFVVTSPMPKASFYRFVDGEFDVRFLARRSEYLEFLRRQAVHVVGLNWPDETSVHRDELATIFPTKMPEYLASGVPVLVHCPQEYYLARFIRERGCGLVVSDRDPGAIETVMQRLMRETGLRAELGRRALEVVRDRFCVTRVVSVLARHLDDVQRSLRGA